MTRGRFAGSSGAGEHDSRAVLEALEDDDCRAILTATSKRAKTAKELIERCGLPRSTLYRKLDLLTEAALLEERTRIRHAGKHVREYQRRVEQVVVTISTDPEVELRSSIEQTAEEPPLPGD
ncbi:MAG: helix-turn-helix domain-containing protein [Natrialbaceae archaeon]|nr:helix-turn-helix domain-containing protein [Natrialbaceae archaeon]